MKFSLIFLSVVAFIISSKTNAFDVPKACLNIKAVNKDCVTCSVNKIVDNNLLTIGSLSEDLTLAQKKYNLFAQKTEELNSANTVLKNKLGSMFRLLRDKQIGPNELKAVNEINKISEDFNKLTILSKESHRLQKKFDICLTNCSSVRRIELLDDIKKVQKLKMVLLIGQPILANKAFEKLHMEMTNVMIDNDQFLTRNIFEAKLKDALFDNLKIILEKGEEYEKFKFETKDTVKDRSDLVSRFPLISEDLVHKFSSREINENENKIIACEYIDSFKKMTNKKEYQQIALDVGLFAVPFALGPLGRIGGFSAELIFGERLAVWGLKSQKASNALKLSDLALQAGMNVNELKSIYDKLTTCQELETLFLSNADESKLNNLNECKNELANRIFLSELASISLATATFGPKALGLLKSMSLPTVKSPKTIQLLLKDFGGGKNNVIKKEIGVMISSTKKDSEKFINFSSAPIEKNKAIKLFKEEHKLEASSRLPTIITDKNLIEYESKIASDTVELLYIPGSEIPFLPNSVNKVGHVAIRIGNKVYHQTGGSGFKIETFDNFLHVTKKKYKVFGQVMKVSEKEKAVMESYFQKMYDKQLPYSFLVNNCAQAVCRAMKLADFEKVKPMSSFDPVAILVQLKRSERVVMKTLYNAEKDLSIEGLRRATLNNRLAFYGVPSMAAGSTAIGTYQAVDFVIEYLDQIKEADFSQ